MYGRELGVSTSLPAIDTSQQELRKAGEEFFQKFLEQARKGQNPLDAAPRARRKPDVELGDAEDLETVGRILPYVYGALYFASSSAKLVMAKRSLEALGTPGVQVFLHLLPSVCATAAFADIGYLSGKALQSCSVSILIFAIQTISLFGALNYSSLYLVLAWTSLVPPAILYNRRMAKAQADRPGLLNALLIAIGLSGAALVLLHQLWPSLLGGLCLAGWTFGEGLKLVWSEFRESPDEGLIYLGLSIRERLKTVAVLEREQAPGAAAFFDATFSAAPALLIGLIFGEGTKLVDHELSVPAVSRILISCAAWSVCTVTSCLYFGRAPQASRERITAFTAIAALVLQVTLNGAGHPLALCAEVLAILGGVGAQQCR